MHEEERVALGQRVRNARKQLRLTQQQLADRAGVSLGVISNLEGGRTVPQGANRRAIARALEADVFEDQVAQSTRDLWSTDVQVFTDVLGQYLSGLDAEARADQVAKWMSDIVNARTQSGPTG